MRPSSANTPAAGSFDGVRRYNSERFVSSSSSSSSTSRRFTVQANSGDAYVIDVESGSRDQSSSSAAVTVYKRTASFGGCQSATDESRTRTRTMTSNGTAGTGTRLQSRTTRPQTILDISRKTDNSISGPLVLAQQAVQDAQQRLKFILRQLSRGNISLEDIRRNIEYAKVTLERAFEEQCKLLNQLTVETVEEKDELAELTPDSVPDEVRQWLAATFSQQQLVATSRAKPKFKTVAHAIRTGIFFEKLFRGRQMSAAPIPQNIAELMKNDDNWSFDAFELSSVSGEHALKYVGLNLFNKYGFLDRFRISSAVLERYLAALEVGYTKHANPYHNAIHAADVTHTAHWMISQTGLGMFAVIFAAMIHDFEHTGQTNNFHVQSGSEYALMYNDRNVLESHHASRCFRMMHDKSTEMSLVAGLSREQYIEFRALVIEMVLATDMSSHFIQLKTMKAMLASPDELDKTRVLCLLVHACDISHPAKPFELHHRWTDRLLEEFFRQGDLERSLELAISPLCDRGATHVAESQIGFIDFIVEPTLHVTGDMLTKMVEPLLTDRQPSSLAVSADKSALCRSPTLVRRSSSALSAGFCRLPTRNSAGKVQVPQPWVRCMQQNKLAWKEKAVKEDADRKKRAAAGNSDQNQPS